jgi:hypothetical protein
MESGDRLDKSQDKRQERTFGRRKRCCACGGTGEERYSGNFWSRERPLILLFIVSKWKEPTAPFKNGRIPMIFLDDNARPHRSRQTQQKLQDMGWEQLEHPPYSPDMAPSDFYLSLVSDLWNTGCAGKSSE